MSRHAILQGLTLIAGMALFEEGVREFTAGHFARSHEIFSGLIREEPRDGPAKYYCERAREMMTLDEPPANWDGVERLTEK